MTTQTKATDTPDSIKLAEESFVELKDKMVICWRGHLANKLINSPDFKVCNFTFSIWQIATDTYEWKSDADKHAAILIANQSTLESALKYMKKNRVMVHNRDYLESEGSQI